MISDLKIDDLLLYTAWQRGQWLAWLRERDAHVLAIAAGPGGDGRFETVGDVLKHIFSAEKRYIERLMDRPIADPAPVAPNDVEALFQFGGQSRRDLQAFIEGLTVETGDTPVTITFMNKSLTASPQKIVTHVLMHEIRHWAQIATILRLNGHKVEMHDFLFSPLMGFV